MKVVTVINNENDPFFILLKLSCAINGLKLVTLVSNKSEFNSRRIKDDLLNDYLFDEADDEIILFTDGTDAVFVANEEEILMKFSQFKTDLVFSAEMTCFPDKDLESLYKIDERTPYNFLNSGGFIGKAGLIKNLLNENIIDIEKFPWSNQYVWTKRYLNNTDKILLDKYCEIFCTLYTPVGEEFYHTDSEKSFNYKRKWFDTNILISKNRFQNKITGTWPCQAHFNGSAKMFLDNNITQMVYTSIPGYKQAEFYFEK